MILPVFLFNYYTCLIVHKYTLPSRNWKQSPKNHTHINPHDCIIPVLKQDHSYSLSNLTTFRSFTFETLKVFFLFHPTIHQEFKTIQMMPGCPCDKPTLPAVRTTFCHLSLFELAIRANKNCRAAYLPISHAGPTSTDLKLFLDCVSHMAQ